MRRIVDETMYMVLATADPEGRPWVSPVWFATATYTEFFWASDPGARHSRNLASRPEVAIVIFNSTVPIGGAEAVYVEALAEELAGSELERGLEVYSARSRAVGARDWTVDDVTGAATLRLYRANASARFLLGPHDRRLPVTAST